MLYTMNKVFTVALSSFVVAAIMTTVVFQIASAVAHNGHGHYNENKNNFHENDNVVENNDDGSHFNSHLNVNSNNDKGIVTHENSH